MKDMWKYILIGLAVATLYWLWIALFSGFFNGISLEAAVTMGTGFFLSFELVILTAIMIAKIKSQ